MLLFLEYLSGIETNLAPPPRMANTQFLEYLSGIETGSLPSGYQSSAGF